MAVGLGVLLYHGWSNTYITGNRHYSSPIASYRRRKSTIVSINSDTLDRKPTRMNKITSTILLFCGILLLIIGVSVPNTAHPYLAPLFADSPIDKAIMVLVVGVVATIIGLVELVRGSKD